MQRRVGVERRANLTRAVDEPSPRCVALRDGAVTLASQLRDSRTQCGGYGYYLPTSSLSIPVPPPGPPSVMSGKLAGSSVFNCPASTPCTTWGSPSGNSDV